MPRSCGLMRPSADTAQASVKTREAPPTARLPRWTRCQSLAKPSVLEYWHMGETTMGCGGGCREFAMGRIGSWKIGCSGRGKSSRRSLRLMRAVWGSQNAARGSGNRGRLPRRPRELTLRTDDAGSQDESSPLRRMIQRKAKDLTPRARRKSENTEKGNGNCEERAALKLWQAGAQPFDPALRDLRMNCAAAQFTSSAATDRYRCGGAKSGRLRPREL